MVRCFQREYARGEKTEEKRIRALRERMTDVVGTGERFIPGLCSEYSIAASRGPDWEPPPVSLAVERLATMIEDELSSEEERLLVWISNELDVSVIAREFGVKYDTLAKRIRRLRARMRTAAVHHAEHFSLEERQALVGFFTRANRVFEAAALSATIDEQPPAPPTNRRGDGIPDGPMIEERVE